MNPGFLFLLILVIVLIFSLAKPAPAHGAHEVYQPQAPKESPAGAPKGCEPYRWGMGEGCPYGCPGGCPGGCAGGCPFGCPFAENAIEPYSPRVSPRSSPRGSPRSSPRRSPRGSPRRSPRGGPRRQPWPYGRPFGPSDYGWEDGGLYYDPYLRMYTSSYPTMCTPYEWCPIGFAIRSGLSYPLSAMPEEGMWRFRIYDPIRRLSVDLPSRPTPLQSGESVLLPGSDSPATVQIANLD